MTPAAFADARKQLGVSQLQLAYTLGIDASSVSHYERGKHPVPRDVAYTLLRMTGQVGGPCRRCGNPTLVAFWDQCCGHCTQPLAEAL